MFLFAICVTLAVSISAMQKDENEQRFSESFENRFREMELKFDVLLQEHIALKGDFQKLDTENKDLQKTVSVLQKQNKKQFNAMRTYIDRKVENVVRKYAKEKKPEPVVKSNKIVSDFTANDAVGGYDNNITSQQGLLPVYSDSSMVKAEGKRLLLPATTLPPQTVSTNSHAAFHARMSKILSNPGDNQHIEFDNVITNVGNAYLGSAGTFVCPEAGTYVFFVTMLSLPDKYLETEIVVNGNQLAHIYSYNDHHYNSGSNMIVLSLKEHDAVWVRVAGTRHHDGDVAAAYWSNFSGFFLY